MLSAGLLVDTLDILGALANDLAADGKTPIKVFQFIASGVFGKAAFAAGILIVCVGLPLSFLAQRHYAGGK